MTPHQDTLLLFGGTPDRYLEEWEITADLDLAARVMDVRFVSVPTGELQTRMRALSPDEQAEAESLAHDLLDGASPARRGSMPLPPAVGNVQEAARLYLAMRASVREHDAQAVTIACSPWIHGDDKPMPCMALMLFQEEGIPAACQGDIDALLTMVLFERISGRSSFKGGAIKARGALGINHCVTCRNMMGPDTPLQPYRVSTYHGRKESPTVWTEIPAGETVTVARLTRNLATLLLFRGPVVATDTHNTRCRNTLVIDVPSRDRTMRAVKGHQNHYVSAVGDHVAALTAWAEDKRIEVVRLDG